MKNFQFNADQLRVTTVVTTDGLQPKIDPDTGQKVTKETLLPLTAKKYLEARNRILPAHLKMIIEEVGPGDIPVPETSNPEGKPLPAVRNRITLQSQHLKKW